MAARDVDLGSLTGLARLPTARTVGHAIVKRKVPRVWQRRRHAQQTPAVSGRPGLRGGKRPQRTKQLQEQHGRGVWCQVEAARRKSVDASTLHCPRRQEAGRKRRCEARNARLDLVQGSVVREDGSRLQCYQTLVGFGVSCRIGCWPALVGRHPFQPPCLPASSTWQKIREQQKKREK